MNLMNLEQWSCLNDACQSGDWFVKRSAKPHDLWKGSADIEDQSIRVATSAPICPYCGTTLSPAVQRERDAQPALRSASRSSLRGLL